MYKSALLITFHQMDIKLLITILCACYSIQSSSRLFLLPMPPEFPDENAVRHSVKSLTKINVY